MNTSHALAEQLFVELDWIAEHLDDPAVRVVEIDVNRAAYEQGHVLDVRSQAEYDGERFWPSGAPEETGRAGHIPGSVHPPIEQLRSEDGHFKGPDELRRILGEHGITPDRPIVTYCTIGNRAGQAWFAMSHLLDYPDVDVYYGSWAEWGMHPDSPVDGPR